MGSIKEISFKQLTTNKNTELAEQTLGQTILDLGKMGVPSDIIARQCLDYGFLCAEVDDIHDPVEVTTWMAIIDEVYERAKSLREGFDKAYEGDV